MERSASLKNERNPEENFQNIILAGNEANRIEKHRTENNKKEKNQEICVRRVTYDDSSKDISFFSTTGVLKASIAIILRWLRKQFRTCS